MFLYAADAIQSGFTKIIVSCVDTDVLVLAMALVQKLQALAQESIQLWVVFGTGEHLRYLAAHEIANTFTNNAFMAKARRPRWTPGRAFQKSLLCLSPFPELKQK